jgi:hypothetical protein
MVKRVFFIYDERQLGLMKLLCKLGIIESVADMRSIRFAFDEVNL